MNRHQSDSKCMIIATAQDAKVVKNIGLIFDEVHGLSSISISYNNSQALDLIAHPLNIHITSKVDEVNSANIKLTIRQILYLLKKLVNDESSVDKMSFFQTARITYESKKITGDMDNDEIMGLPQQSMFSIKKNNKFY
jgi:hypothetical protein